jgi:hypothetical protein
MIAALRSYKKAHGNCNVPHGWKDNPELGKWCQRQRYEYKNNELSQDRIAQLEQLEFAWDPHAAAWEKKFAALRAYKQAHGDCDIPQKWKGDPALARWCGTQRTLCKSNKLSADRIARLNKLAFVWDPFSSAWKEMFAQLRAYKKKHGDCNVPQGYKENPGLGSWCRRQRKLYESNELSEDQITRLKKLGFVWSLFNVKWKEMFAQLRAYKKKHGDCNVPAKYLANQELGNWCSQQRTMFRSTKLLPDRIKKLKEIEFQFSVRELKRK